MDFQNCPQCDTLNPPGAKQCEQCKAELPEVPDFVPPPRPPETEPEPPAPPEPAGFEAPPEILARVQQLEGEIAKRPSANALYLQLCQVYLDAKRTDLAAGILERCLEHDPKNVYIRHRLGQLTGPAPPAPSTQTSPPTTTHAAPPPSTHLPSPAPARPAATAAAVRAPQPGASRPSPVASRPPTHAVSRPDRHRSRRLLPALAGGVALVAVAIAVKMLFFPGTRRLVTGSFSAFGPEWSPTGRQFAFLMQEGGTARLGVYDLRKGSHRALVNVAGADASAYAWSPDGRRIAYVGTDEGGWQEAVFVIEAEGGQPRRIAAGASPSWSADGGELLMWCAGELAPPESVPDGSAYFGGEAPGPCRVGVDGGGVRRSPGSAEAFFGGGAVSPTLGQIVFERMSGSGDETAGAGTTAEGEFQDMVDSVVARGATNFAEGSRDLRRELESRAYMRRKRGEEGEAGYSSDIFVMGFDGGLPVQLTSDGRSSFPSWTPDGTRILFYSAGSSGGELWMMGADGSDRKPVLKSPLKIADPAAVALTADGRSVVFAAPVEADAGVARIMTGESPADLHVAEVGSAKAERLSNRHPFKQRFALSPDGKRIVYEVLAETGTLTMAATRSELWMLKR